MLARPKLKLAASSGIHIQLRTQFTMIENLAHQRLQRRVAGSNRFAGLIMQPVDLADQPSRRRGPGRANQKAALAADTRCRAVRSSSVEKSVIIASVPIRAVTASGGQIGIQTPDHAKPVPARMHSRNMSI